MEKEQLTTENEKLHLSLQSFQEIQGLNRTLNLSNQQLAFDLEQLKQ